MNLHQGFIVILNLSVAYIDNIEVVGVIHNKHRILYHIQVGAIEKHLNTSTAWIGMNV